MTDANFTQAQEAIRRAYQALRANDRVQARQFAAQAAQLDPTLEDPWLILAGLAGPQAAVQYLKRALLINPDSERAHRGMVWAVQRMEAAPQPPEITPVPPAAEPNISLGATAATAVATTPVAAHPIAKTARRAWVGWLVGLLAVLILAGAAWLTWPWISGVFAQSPGAARPAGVLQKPSLTPTFTPTFTPTSSPTATSTPTATFTFTPTYTATPLPSSTYTSTPVPTNTRVPPTKTKAAATKIPAGSSSIPSNIQADQRWVDVDLSEQKAYAYQGTQLVRSFVVSTGISIYPTLTGQYHVYVKYRYADMSGVGWYLPKVPYVMYYYKGYGLHGTYWHNNFGHPMSHGCINFRTEDAAWLFDFASVGTLVNIHN